MKKEQIRLYAVTDRRWLQTETLEEQVEKALKGGITMLQLREKEMDDAAFLEEAVRIKKLCQAYSVPFIINDRVDIAIRSGADGVHVGQGDMSAAEVRKRLGKDKIVGVTAKTVEQALLAQEQGADYIGSGAVFGSGTKSDARTLDHAILQEICERVSIPVTAIGGITAENAKKLSGRGMAGIAVVSAIFAQPDITEAVRKLKVIADEICD